MKISAKIAWPAMLLLLLNILIGNVYSQPASPENAGPLIRVEPESLSYQLPRYTWINRDFHIYNDGDQPLNVSITDVQTGARAAGGPPATISAEAFVRSLQRRLGRMNLPLLPPVETSRESLPSSSPLRSVVITDPAGDTNNPGIDVVSVGIEENFFNYIFTINFNAAPDTAALAILSIDLDQNFGTGAFPAPLGFGPGLYDVGAEYDIVFDIGNFLGDTLGLSASAYAIQGGDTSFTPVGISLPLSIAATSVEAQFVKFLTPSLIDDNLNACLVSLGLLNLSLPDFAPDYGHGLLGQENGLSWLTELDSSGFSAIPLTGTIAPGDSLPVQARLVSVNPEGSYSAEIHIANNSANTPNLALPVSVSIMGLSAPVLQVTPLQISDTLTANQVPQIYDITIANTGQGTLLFLVSDSLPEGENWLAVPPLSFGQLAAGESEVVAVTVDPAGLNPNQAYLGYVQITSNDTLMPRLDLPVEIFIQPPSSLEIGETVPVSPALYPNYPNPFNPVTRIKFDVPRSGPVKLEIFTILGQRVATPVAQTLLPGQYTVDWNARNDLGEPLGSGIYIYRLTIGETSLSRKMILLR